MSAGDVLGLYVPADSKNLESAQSISTAEAVVTKLNPYNKVTHDKVDTDEEKDEESVDSVRERVRVILNKPSNRK